MSIKRILLIVLSLLFLVSPVWGATIFVKQTASGAGDGDGSCADADDLATVQTTADDDDVIVLCDDTYTTDLNPGRSGSSGHVVTFQSQWEYDASGSQYGAVFNDGSTITRNYILIDGLYWTGSGAANQLMLTGASNVEITACKFDDNLWDALRIRTGSSYNYVHDNLFDPSADKDGKVGTMDMVSLKEADYNRIIDNTFSEGSNHAFISVGLSCDHNIIRGNTMTMTRAFIDSNRTGADYTVSEIFLLEKNAQYNLIEDNVTTFIGTPLTSTDSEQIPVQINACSYNIIRKNTFNNTKGDSAIYSDQSYHNEYNLFYNNTYYKTNNFAAYLGLWTLSANAGGYYTRYNQFTNNLIHTCTYRGFMSGDIANQRAYITDNEFRTNIMYGVGGTNVARGDDDVTFATAETNWPDEFSGTITTEPTFTNEGSGDFTADDGNAPQVDTGVWLTTVNGGTTSTTITVDDYPYFFYDGYGISGETGDTIKTENGQTAVISSINYGTKQITFTTQITVIDGEGIALDYAGQKPDIGAEEYSSPAPGVGIENPDPSDEAEGISTTKDLGWTNGASVTDVDVYFDATDCTTKVVDGVDTETYDTGTMANDDIFYWKVVVNPDAENLSFPSTGCYTFTTIETPPTLSEAIYNSTGPTRIYDSAGSAWVYVAP